mgnify:CR=1 FL=1
MSNLINAIQTGKRPVRKWVKNIRLSDEDILFYNENNFLEIIIQEKPLLNFLEIDHNWLLLDEDIDWFWQYTINYETKIIRLEWEILTAWDSISIKYQY